MIPTGEPEEHYFTTSPRADDKYHFFSSGYEHYLGWLLHPKAPVLYLTGPSGSGKSSLINAYLAPQLENAKSSKTKVYSLRSYHKPLHVLYDAFAIEKKPNVIINAETVLNEIENAAKLLSANEKILIVLDQFEEFFLLRNKAESLQEDGEESDEDTGSLEELKNFFHRFISNPPKSVCILLSYRDDFQQLIDQLALPARIEHVNFEQVKLLSFDQASKFLRNCPGLNIPEKRLKSILSEAASIDTPVAIRPIVLNLLGIILKQMVGQSNLSKREGNLIRQYIIGCLGKELQQERATVLKEMLTDFNTARPRTIKELSQKSKLSVSQLDNQMITMHHYGLVRCLDFEEPRLEKRKWQIAHDFVALQLEKVAFGISKTIWDKGKAWIAPVLTSILIVLISFLMSNKENEQKKKAIENIENAGLFWLENPKTIIPVGKNLPDSLFQELLKDWAILQPDSLILLFSYDNKKKFSNINGLNKIKSLRKIIISNDSLKNVDGLKGLPALTILDLSSCYSLKDVDGLKDIKSLKELNLSFCLELSNIEGLKGLTALEELNLYDCPKINKAQIDELIKALPQLKTFYNDYYPNKE